MRTVTKQTNRQSVHTVNGGSPTLHSGLWKDYRLDRSDIVHNSKDDRGFRDPSYYLATVTDNTGPIGMWTNSSFGYTTRWEGNLSQQLYSEGPGLPGFSAGLRSRAEVGALLKLKDQSVDLSVMFAERKRTADLIAASFGAVIKGYSALRRGNVRGAMNALGLSGRPPRMPADLGGKWLALQYGWKPILSDVHGACEALSYKEDANGYRVTVRKVEKEEWEEEYFLDTGPSFCPFRQEIRYHRSVRVVLNYSPNNWEQIKFASLGLTNPAHTAWELIPFSFVVDWAIPIGDWISSLDAASGYEFLGGTLTDRRFHISRYLSASQFNGKNTSHITGGRIFRKRVERHVYPSSPIPTLPRLKNPWSYGHAANAAALLAVVTSGAKAPRYAR